MKRWINKVMKREQPHVILTNLQKERYIILGDVHGCYDEMRLLLNKCEYNNKKDQLIFVGDLVNKGPKSKQVVEYALKQDALMVLGNHDYYTTTTQNKHKLTNNLNKKIFH